MMNRRRAAVRWVVWPLAWVLLVGAGSAWLVRWDITQRREVFAADARAAHRLLSQRAAQLDATLAALVLLPASAREPEQRLIAFYPELIAVQRRSGDAPWVEPLLAAAETRSRATGHASIAGLDKRALAVVRAGTPDSVALRIDAARLVPWSAWPAALAPGGPVRVSVSHPGRSVLLQPGAADPPAGWTAGFVFDKALDLPGWPLSLQLQRATGPAEWPWASLVAMALTTALALGAAAWWRHNQRQRQRAEELLRVSRVARLNALGELAGGIAHELNQPLAAVMANVQAARRLLDDEDDAPQARAQAREAVQQAAAQARRAADVVARLRQRIESPDAGLTVQAVDLAAVCAQVLELLDPALRERAIDVRVQGRAPRVRADPVALEQIVHNLAGNAMQALQEVPAAERRLVFGLDVQGALATLVVRDNGPGIANELWPRLFEPFVTTRGKGQGLGLGLSLCRSLAQSMGGSLDAVPVSPRGVEFKLTLPVAD
jgi:signal transduction histidine kinase